MNRVALNEMHLLTVICTNKLRWTWHVMRATDINISKRMLICKVEDMIREKDSVSQHDGKTVWMEEFKKAKTPNKRFVYGS